MQWQPYGSGVVEVRFCFPTYQFPVLIKRNRLPEDNSKWKDNLDYYIWLAKLAERGKITGIFFADIYGVHDSYPGQSADQFRSGATCAQMDPVVFVSAMAAVSTSVSFGITGSTSYINVSSCRSRHLFQRRSLSISECF